MNEIIVAEVWDHTYSSRLARNVCKNVGHELKTVVNEVISDQGMGYKALERTYVCERCGADIVTLR